MAKKGTLTVRLIGDKRPLEKTLGGAGRSLGKFVAKVGAAAAAAAGVVAVKGVQAAREAQKINRITENVIKTTGGAANVTADQVDDLSGRLQKLTGVSDETIQRGSNMLLTFTNIRNEVGKNNDIFDQATGIALDLSVAMGTDVKDSAIQVGKALNDPIKGVSALQRVGITFTDQQKDQIATMMENNDTLGAQKVILAELERQFGGTAEAAADPMQKLQSVIGDVLEVIGVALLPLVDKMAEWLSDKLPKAVETGQKAFEIFAAALSGHTYAQVLGEQHGGIIEIAGKLGEKFKKVKDVVITAVDRIKEWWDRNGPRIIERIREVAQAVLTWWRDTARPAIEKFAGALRRFWTETVQPTLREIATAWEENKDTIGEITEDLIGIVESIGEIIGGVFSGAQTDVEDSTGGMAEDIGDLITTIEGITSAVAGFFEMLDQFAGPVTRFAAAVGRIMTPLFLLQGLLENIRGLQRAIFGGPKSVGSGFKRSDARVPSKIVGLHEGALVKARPGGIIANIGEGREDEIVAPLSKFEKMVRGSGHQDARRSRREQPILVQVMLDKRVLGEALHAGQREFA